LAAEKVSAEASVEASQNSSIDDIRDFSLEAEQVEILKHQNGWKIIERDCIQYRTDIGSKLAYLDPKSKEFTDARILFIAADKTLSLFNDYVENRKRALELLEKIDNTAENIVLDVDN
jgi:hypothetical protein